MEAGIDSLGATELQQTLSDHLSTNFDPTLLFDHPSIDGIISFYASSRTSTLSSPFAAPTVPMQLEPLKAIA